MPDVTIHDVDADTLEQLRQFAEYSALDFEECLRRALASAVPSPTLRRALELQAYFKNKYGIMSDSTPTIRDCWDE